IIGKLNLFWTNKPLLNEEYNQLGGASSFLGFPKDPVSGQVVHQSNLDPLIQRNAQGVAFVNFERGIMYYTPQTGAVAVGATGTTPDGRGGTNLSGTLIIRGSPVDDKVVVKSVSVPHLYTDPEPLPDGTHRQLSDHSDKQIEVHDTFSAFPQFDFKAVVL